MKIALTGRPGIGKTTCVKRAVSLLSVPAVGFWTEEIRKNGRRWGFKVVRTDGKEALLASVEGRSPYKVGRYKVFVREFEAFLFPFLNSALNPTSVAVIDEIGKMELLSRRFARFVEQLILSEGPALVTIPQKDVHPLVAQIRSSGRFKVITVTLQNRDKLPEKIVNLLEGRDGEEGAEKP
ncbi:NTPase [Thermovibrio ammonificans]|jgi:nucleoside-triphosphatase|uniref:Nucleoside-triphosphatase n=1 Tax=Thermovibrio ammonificans (strain DSM 15698 / JCM 12110 / HB-1) TaxID=648996 RepID=E8T608_THEA1|nr:NTPase [Thermovibrio ammonificans]ADU96592.1 Nucleoside-triphosphatase [Thermovibrio ammonificans HB-1]